MSLDEILRRICNAQIALAYIKNILREDEQKFLKEIYNVELEELEVHLEATLPLSLFATLHEIQWHMNIIDVQYYIEDGKALCQIVVDLKKEHVND